MKFYVGIGEGDVIPLLIDSSDLESMTAELAEVNKNSVWLISSGGHSSKTIIAVTEGVNLGKFISLFKGEEEVYFFDCRTYEDAYIIARDMREGNILCYGG